MPKGVLPRRSDAGLRGEAIVYLPYNEVSFFVEDNKKEQLYFRILKKLFPGIEITKILPLNGKDNLINYCKKCRIKKSIFIADKDFDDLFGLQIKKENLFYLQDYSIENYFLEQKAVHEYIIDEKPLLSDAVIRSKLDVEDFVTVTKNEVALLVFLFIFVHKNAQQITNIKSASSSPEQFCGKSKSKISAKGIRAYKAEILKAITSQGLKLNLEHEIKKIHRQLDYKKTSDKTPNNIPGKFLVRLLQHKLQEVFGISSRNMDSFCIRIANQSEFNSLEYLKESINTHLASI